MRAPTAAPIAHPMAVRALRSAVSASWSARASGVPQPGGEGTGWGGQAGAAYGGAGGWPGGSP